MGETELRGFEDPVKVWELRGQDDNETLCLRGRGSTDQAIQWWLSPPQTTDVGSGNHAA